MHLDPILTLDKFQAHKRISYLVHSTSRLELLVVLGKELAHESRVGWQVQHVIHEQSMNDELPVGLGFLEDSLLRIDVHIPVSIHPFRDSLMPAVRRLLGPIDRLERHKHLPFFESLRPPVWWANQYALVTHIAV